MEGDSNLRIIGYICMVNRGTVIGETFYFSVGPALNIALIDRAWLLYSSLICEIPIF